MSKTVYHFRRYRQSQDGATIPEESEELEESDQRRRRRRRSTVVLEDRIYIYVYIYINTVIKLFGQIDYVQINFQS